MVNWTAITTPGELLNVPNTNTDGSFWTVVLYMIWVVLIVVFSGFGIEVALLGATFIALVASIFLAFTTPALIAWENVLFFLGFLLFYIIYIIWSSSKDQ